MQSSTLIKDPKRASPSKERALPDLAQLRIERLEPRWSMSRIESDEPNRHAENTDSWLPK
jgi:hypothetical protein